MFGQIGPIQIDTSLVPGSQIQTPPDSYITIFWCEVGGIMKLFCKGSDGVVHTVKTETGIDIICGEALPA